MYLVLYLSLFYFSFVHISHAQLIKRSVDRVLSILADTSSPEKPRFIAYPTIAFTPETRWEFGISSLFVYHAARDTSNRLSEINAFTFITLEQQYGLWLDHALYSDKNNWFFLGSLRWQSFPLRYYGIGPDTQSDYSHIVEGNYFLLRERFLRRVISSIYTGLEIDIQSLWKTRFVPSNIENMNPLPLGSAGGGHYGIGWGLVYDDRHNILNVREGFFGEIAFLRYNLFGSPEDRFSKASLDLRYYQPTFKNQVLAFQVLGINASGPVPFNLMAEMGGEVIMRGFFRGRYRDNSLLAVQAEYRWLPFPFSKRFGAALFSSFGNVADRWQNLGNSRWKWAAGGGLRFLLFPRKDIFTRLDYALTSDGSGIYFYIGEAF